jgi:thiosulfate/3-mercaptopyruvate sulfurtransferase
MPQAPAPLIRSRDLAALLAADVPPVVLDVRWVMTGSQPQAYLEGHIPGAVFCDLETDLSDLGRPVEEAGRHPLPSAQDFTDAMRELGVRADRTVVVYDAKESVAAARAWWCLTYFGHPDVRVLDGGLSAWSGDGGALSRGDGRDDLRLERACVEPGAFTAVPGGLAVVDIDEVAAGAGLVLIDVRAGERFRGEVEPMDPIPGRIPGAINSPTMDLVESDGRFLVPDALRARFDAVGVPELDNEAVAAYCGSGVTAAHTVLALKLVGIDAALFPGSYSQWCRDPLRPIAKGPADQS